MTTSKTLPPAGLCAGSLLAAAVFSAAILSAAPKPGNAAKGKQVFGDTCDVCHNADSAEVKVGPGLKGLFKKAALHNKKQVTDENVLDIINKGSPSGMPGFEESLTEQERADVLAYLKTL
jgi:cytochrome c